MNPGKDFRYLTYHTAVKYGEFKAYIYQCDNYPLCKLDLNTLESSQKLLDYNSASISYKKNEYNDTISPISKKQNMLLLTCQTESCKLFTSMYTNKNNLNVFLTVPYYKYIRENNEDNYYMSIKKSFMNSFSIMKVNTYIYVNIEILSGNISINAKNNEEFSTQNKKLFIFIMDKLNEFSLKIIANENSMYSIGASIHTDDIDILTPNINYLLKINNSKSESALIFAEVFESTNVNYFGFFNENCNIEVKYSNSPLPFTENFAQDYQIIDNKVKSIQYKVNKVENENDNCLFSASMHNLKAENNAIILGTGVKYPFRFNENNNIISFIHIDTEKEKDLIINLNILDQSEYYLTLFYNEKGKESFDIIESNNITISSSNLTNNCEENDQPCKINFILKSKNKNTNPIIEIQVFHQDENEDDKDDDEEEKEAEEEKEDKDKKEDEDEKAKEEEEGDDNNDDDSKTLYIIIGAVGSFIILLIILLFILRCRKKGDKNLKEKIEEVFEQEGETNELSLLQKDEK